MRALLGLRPLLCCHGNLWTVRDEVRLAIQSHPIGKMMLLAVANLLRLVVCPPGSSILYRLAEISQISAARPLTYCLSHICLQTRLAMVLSRSLAALGITCARCYMSLSTFRLQPCKMVLLLYSLPSTGREKPATRASNQAHARVHIEKRKSFILLTNLVLVLLRSRRNRELCPCH